MIRLGFTIIFNGKHHLEHLDYAEKMIGAFDHWVFVEGAAGTQGSTHWCNPISNRWQSCSGHSKDGTLEWLDDFCARHKNASVVTAGIGGWQGKDQMVNAAADLLRTYTANAMLWEIDADEQWGLPAIQEAEAALVNSESNCGEFHCNYYVGKDLIAIGEWGEGLKLPYRRLWRWCGEHFRSHEPPRLSRNEVPMLLPQKFSHYAYVFPQDVEFKQEYYTGHENLLNRWLDLQDETKFPQPISRLISGDWGKTKTEIHKV